MISQCGWAPSPPPSPDWNKWLRKRASFFAVFELGHRFSPALVLELASPGSQTETAPPGSWLRAVGLLRRHHCINLWVSHTHNCKPTFAPPCTHLLLVLFPWRTLMWWVIPGEQPCTETGAARDISLNAVLRGLRNSVLLLYPPADGPHSR